MPKSDALKVINSRTNGRLHASASGAIYSGDGMADTLDGYDASKQPGPSLIPVALADGKLDPGWLPEQASSGAGASATGGQVYVAPWVRLARAISETDTTIYLNGAIHAAGDQAILGHYQYGNEGVTITGGPTQQGTLYEYTITRAATPRAYPAGSTVVFNLGSSTDGGFITMVSGDQQQTLIGPHLNMFAYEDGAAVRKVRIGRLQGLSSGEKAQFPKVDDWNVYGLYADAAYLRGQIVADSGDIAGDLDVGGTLGVWSGLGRAGVVLGNSEGGHGITLQNREGRPVFGAVSPYEDEAGVLSDVAVYIDHEGQRGLYYHKNAATGQYQLDISVDTLIDGTLRATNILAGTGAYPSAFTGMRFGAEGLQGYNAGVAQVDLDVQDGRLYFGNREGWLSNQGITFDVRDRPEGRDAMEDTVNWLVTSSQGDMIGAAIGTYSGSGWFAEANKRMIDAGILGAQSFTDFVTSRIELMPGGTTYIEGTTIEMRPSERWAVVFDPDHVLEFNRARMFAPAVTVAGSLLHTTDDKQSVLVGTNSASGARLISMADNMPAFRATRSSGQTFDITVEASRTLIGASSTIQIYTGAVDASGQGQIIPFGAMRLGSQAAPWADIYATRLHGTIGSQVAIADNSSMYLTRQTMTLGVNLEADNVIAYATQSDLPVGDFIQFEDVDGNQETIRINTVGAVAGDWYEYEIERAQATGQTPLLWYAGTVGVSLGGNATDGYIRLFGTDDLNPATGPSIVIYQRENDDVPESVSERAVFGNLSGWYHYADNADLYGVAFGRKSGAWASMDETNGLRMFWNETQLAQYGEAIDIGQPDAAHLHIDADDVTLYAGPTAMIELLGTGSANITGTLAVATGGAITWAGGKGKADNTGLEHAEDATNYFHLKPTSDQFIYATSDMAETTILALNTGAEKSSAIQGTASGIDTTGVYGLASGAGGRGVLAAVTGAATIALAIQGGIVDGGSQRYTAMADATADTDGLNRQTGDGRYLLQTGTAAGATAQAQTFNLGVNVTTGYHYAINSVRMVSTHGTANYWFGPSGNATLSGDSNFGVGTGLVALTTGSGNVQMGVNSLLAATEANSCMAIGTNALHDLTTGYSMVAIGNSAGYKTNGNSAVFIGDSAGYNSTGNNNTVIGVSAMYGVAGSTTAAENVMIGNLAGNGITTGGENVMIGFWSGRTTNPAYATTTGLQNTFIGGYAGQASATQRNRAIALGYRAFVDADNTIVLGGVGFFRVKGVIGATTAGALWDVVGGADELQMRVKGYSSQTSALFQAQDSSANVLFSVAGTGGITVNEQGADSDSRFEGDTATQLLVMDAGLDAVQIGTTTAGVIADFRATGTVFNEDGTGTRDLRAESDTEANMLFLDADADTDGALYLGGSTNGIKISKGGDLTCLGTAKYERHVQLDAKTDGTVANQPTAVDFFTAGGLQFASVGAKYAYAQWEIPDDWDGTDVVFEIDWFPDSGATTGTDAVRWTVEYRAIAEGETINNGTSVTLDNGAGGDTADYAQYVTKHSRFTLAYNSANQPLTAQDHVYFKVSRDTGVANDFAGTVTVTAYEIIYQSKGFPTSN